MLCLSRPNQLTNCACNLLRIENRPQKAKTYPSAHSTGQFPPDVGSLQGLLELLIFPQRPRVQGRTDFVKPRIQVILFIYHHRCSGLRVRADPGRGIVTRTQHLFER